MVDTPYQYVESTGVIIADTSEILTEVGQEYKDAFQKQDLVTTPDTPQGALITAETLARDAVVNNNAAVANQINPNLAGGVFQDAILALTGMERGKQSYTIVSGVTLTGIAGTFIPAGVQAKTTAGDIFLSTSDITLNGSGTGVTNFQAMQPGAVTCGSGTLTTIFSGVIGWETVTNPSNGVLGVTTQSDQGAGATRNNTLAFQAIGYPEANTSALSATAGVTSLSYRENYTSSSMGLLASVTNGTTLAATIWGMTTTTGTGTDGAIVVGTDAINFALSLQSLPAINPWPVCKYTTTGNITLSGTATQGGGDWGGALTVGDIILVKNQGTASQNGVWIAASGAWTRHPYNTDASSILGSNDGISMTPNSVYACVNGGSNVDVAAALLENKSSGSGWIGNVTQSVIEPASGQTYTVKFDRPTTVNILVRVTASNVTVAAVQQAILDYAAGLINGLKGFVVGADVSPFELGGAIMAENPGCYVSSVTIALDIISPSFSSNPIPIGLNEIAATSATLITVTIA